jgi:single-strand DNA-binding protein
MADLRMPTLNKVFLTGRLTRDPEVRFTPGGTPVANFAVASNRRFRDQSGEWKEETTFVNVVAWQALAERIRDTLHKGSPVLIEGRIQTRSWENDQGQRRTAFEINAMRVENLERRGGPGAEEEFVGGRETAPSSDDGEDDVPF